MVDRLVLTATKGCLALVFVSKVHFLSVSFSLSRTATVTNVAHFKGACTFGLLIIIQVVPVIALLKGLACDASVFILSFEQKTPLVALVLLGC